jgi:hypothetical protein
MIHLDKNLVIVFCNRANTINKPLRLYSTAKKFVAILRNATISVGFGAWAGDKFVESELNVSVSYWYKDTLDNKTEIVRFLIDHQKDENQECLFVVSNGIASLLFDDNDIIEFFDTL